MSQDVMLADGTWVLCVLPPWLDNQWKKWLGEIWTESIAGVNLVIVRTMYSMKPELLDEEHYKLRQEAFDFFTLLRLSGSIEYEGAEALQGSMYNDAIHIRQIVQIEALYPARDSPRIPVTPDRLEEAAKARVAREAMRAALGQYRRFTHALRVLADGLMQYHGEERLHNFVRSIEGLILPEVGRTRKQFINRCQTFTNRAAGTEKILAEAYDMRSDVEHLHEWDRSLQSYPGPQRENVALHRTRQMEALACFAYSRIFFDSGLQQHFKTDADIKAFWQQPDSARFCIWSYGIDLTSVP